LGDALFGPSALLNDSPPTVAVSVGSDTKFTEQQTEAHTRKATTD